MKSTWKKFRDTLPKDRIVLSRFYSYQFLHTPRNILFSLSTYKFAAKLIGKQKTILEIGCNMGLETLILAEFAKKVVAIDIDGEAVAEGKKAFGKKIEFIHTDFFEAELGRFDALVSMDLLEHISKRWEKKFFENICRHLAPHGICILKTPNKTCQKYALKDMGHINTFSYERLLVTMEKYFHNVFIFSCNDEIVHTGFYPLAYYFIAVGISPIAQYANNEIRPFRSTED